MVKGLVEIAYSATKLSVYAVFPAYLSSFMLYYISPDIAYSTAITGTCISVAGLAANVMRLSDED